jgi:PAS domain S-box-containing protein
MNLRLSPAHSLAQTNYPIRVGSFGYSFIVYIALGLERGINHSASGLVFPVLGLLVYPHLAYVHARIALDSRRAEQNNLVADAVLLGAVVAHTGMSLWLFGGILIAVCVNNAVCGGARRLAIAVLLLCGTSLALTVASGTGFHPGSGPLVTLLCMAGIAAYVSAAGLVMHSRTERLVATRNALARSEDQFRFIAEHAGDYVAVLDARGRLRYTSGAYQEQFDPNLLRKGSHWTGLIEPRDRERARRFLTSILSSGKSARLALDFVPADGSRLELECAANAVEEAGETASRLLVITARRRSTLEQAMQSEPGRQLMRQHPGYGILVTTVLGRIELASPRLGEMLGYRAAELAGKNVSEISEAIPSSDALMEDVWRAIEADGICQRKFLAVDRSGKLKLAWANVIQLVSEDDTRRFAWTILDDPGLTVERKSDVREVAPE